jgi:hypothetical protein
MNPGDVWKCPEVRSKRIPVKEILAVQEGGQRPVSGSGKTHLTVNEGT